MTKNGVQGAPAKVDAPTLQLVLVRHGQSLFNRDGASAGDDSGLTELGWSQAKAVADWLAAHYRVERVVSSTLHRARQTAQVIAQRVGVPPRLQPGLEEAPEPYWQEFPAFPEDDPLAAWEGTWSPTAPAAPVYSGFLQRVREALRTLLAGHSSGTIVIVAHAGTIATLVRGLMGGHNLSLVTDNGAITLLTWQAGIWRLVYHNCQAHLLPLLTQPRPVQPELAVPSLWEPDAQLERVVAQFSRVARMCPADAVTANGRDVARLLKFARITHEDRILDVGAGNGTLSCAIAGVADLVIGVDVTPAMLECAEQTRSSCRPSNVQFQWAEAAALPFPDGSFTMVMCRDLLPYLAHHSDALASFRRVLTNGGRLLLDELVGSDDPVKRATQETIENRRDPSFIAALCQRDLEKLIAEAGFELVDSERYEQPRRMDEWLTAAAADGSTSVAVKSMLEASLVGDAAGMHVRQARDGTITLTQHRVRLLAGKAAAPSL